MSEKGRWRPLRDRSETASLELALRTDEAKQSPHACSYVWLSLREYGIALALNATCNQLNFLRPLCPPRVALGYRGACAILLIGKLVVRDIPDGRMTGRIVETEAYLPGDAACHAYRGMTKRNRSLFRERGHAYIDIVYGTAWMLNVSGEGEGIGAGVLIRALEPLHGIALMQRHRATAGERDRARRPDGSPRRSPSTARWTASISVARGLSGSRMTRPPRGRWARVRGSASRRTQTACCASTCVAAHASAVRAG